MKVAIRNLKNERVGEIELPESVFGCIYREHLIHLAVKAYLAGLRSGTHKTKVRSEVSGSGKKLWKQKGTGRARMGSARSPIWRKGGTVHGPVPRSYAMDLSVREKKNALRSALSRKAAEEKLVVVDRLDLETPKTKALAQALSGLGIDGKTLLVDRWDNEELQLASRNHPQLKTVDALGVNVYDVVDRRYLVFSEGALKRLVEVLGS